MPPSDLLLLYDHRFLLRILYSYLRYLYLRSSRIQLLLRRLWLLLIVASPVLSSALIISKLLELSDQVLHALVVSLAHDVHAPVLVLHLRHPCAVYLHSFPLLGTSCSSSRRVLSWRMTIGMLLVLRRLSCLMALSLCRWLKDVQKVRNRLISCRSRNGSPENSLSPSCTGYLRRIVRFHC